MFGRNPKKNFSSLIKKNLKLYKDKVTLCPHHKKVRKNRYRDNYWQGLDITFS